MPVPSTGDISLGKLRQEVENCDYLNGPYTSNETSLNDLESGVYDTLNTNSSSMPNGSIPNSMSEWYDYVHFCGVPIGDDFNGRLKTLTYTVEDTSNEFLSLSRRNPNDSYFYVRSYGVNPNGALTGVYGNEILLNTNVGWGNIGLLYSISDVHHFLGVYRNNNDSGKIYFRGYTASASFLGGPGETLGIETSETPFGANADTYNTVSDLIKLGPNSIAFTSGRGSTFHGTGVIYWNGSSHKTVYDKMFSGSLAAGGTTTALTRTDSPVTSGEDIHYFTIHGERTGSSGDNDEIGLSAYTCYINGGTIKVLSNEGSRTEPGPDSTFLSVGIKFVVRASVDIYFGFFVYYDNNNDNARIVPWEYNFSNQDFNISWNNSIATPQATGQNDNNTIDIQLHATDGDNIHFYLISVANLVIIWRVKLSDPLTSGSIHAITTYESTNHYANTIETGEKSQNTNYNDLYFTYTWLEPNYTIHIDSKNLSI